MFSERTQLRVFKRSRVDGLDVRRNRRYRNWLTLETWLGLTVLIGSTAVVCRAQSPSPSVNFTEYSVPTSGSRPIGIAAGPDGGLWFTEQTGNKIGRISTAGNVTEFQIP